MKKTIALLLTLCLCAASLMPVFAATSDDEQPRIPQFEASADLLYALGLFAGTDKGYELEAIPTRLQATVMLIRLLGKEEEALEKTRSHPFTDVPGWGDKYVGYAYEAKLTMGFSSVTFGSDDPCEAKMYLTFLLRALGYSDTKKDFAYNDATAFSTSVNLITLAYQKDIDSRAFYRDDMVRCSYLALFRPLKTTELRAYGEIQYAPRLLEMLYDNGAVDKEAATLYMDSILYDVISRRHQPSLDNAARDETLDRKYTHAITYLRQLTAATPTMYMRRPYTIESWRAYSYSNREAIFVAKDRTVRHFLDKIFWLTLDDGFGLMDVSTSYDEGGRSYFVGDEFADIRRSSIPFAALGYWNLDSTSDSYRFSVPALSENPLECVLLENYERSEDGRTFTIYSEIDPNAEMPHLLIADTFLSCLQDEFSEGDYRGMRLNIDSIALERVYVDGIMVKMEMICDVIVNIRGSQIPLKFLCATERLMIAN